MASQPDSIKFYQNSERVLKLGFILHNLVYGPESLRLVQAGRRLGICLRQAKLILKQFGRTRNQKQNNLLLSRISPKSISKQKSKEDFTFQHECGMAGTHARTVGKEHPDVKQILEQQQTRARSSQNTYHCSSSTIIKSEPGICQFKEVCPQTGNMGPQRSQIIKSQSKSQRQVSDSGCKTKIQKTSPLRALRVPSKYPEVPQYFIELDALNLLRQMCQSQEYLTLAINRYTLKRELTEVSSQIATLKNKSELDSASRDELVSLEEKKKTLILHLGKVAEEMLGKLI